MTDNKLEYDGVIANLNAMLDDLNAGFGTNTIEAAIDLINRQRALIEAMTQSLKAMSNIAKAERHEAYKVFAGRVIDLIYDADDINPVSEWQIRNLVKEMAGADDEQKQTNI